MYVYAYDDFLQDRRYERDIALIETRLTDLGITGNVVRLALYRDGVQVLKNEIQKGVKTIVAVGNDRTLEKVLNAVEETRTVIGYIPVTPENPMADLLGIPQGVQACDILSARLIEDIDIGEVNGRRFLHTAVMDGTGCVMACEDRYTVTPLRKASFCFVNLAGQDPEYGIVSPTDGMLTLVTRLPRLSLIGRKADIGKISFRYGRIYAQKPVTMQVDGMKIQAQEFDIRTLPGRLRMITGKQRKFVV